MTAKSRPPVTTELLWTSGLRFGATLGPHALVVDGDGDAGPSPMQLAAVALAGCMAADVVSILRKGRHELAGLRASLIADRAADPPRRFIRITLAFHATGAVPAEAVERAVALSRETYCSVWQSMRPDIELTTTVDVRP